MSVQKTGNSKWTVEPGLLIGAGAGDEGRSRRAPGPSAKLSETFSLRSDHSTAKRGLVPSAKPGPDHCPAGVIPYEGVRR